jgi:ATP-binding cassette subfamily D (ALD) protein 3|tara:strand:- start:5214 stop:7331 length:2118 start_codon:yes stop_codon:yes gene_type:complete
MGFKKSSATSTSSTQILIQNAKFITSKDVIDVASRVYDSYKRDKKLCYTFLIALSGVTALVVHETSAATGLMKNKNGSLGDFRKNKKEKKQINIKNKNVAKKERSSAAVDEQFLSNLVQLGKIVLPSWRCKSVFLLSTQTVMLISRSYISLRIARKGGEGLQAVMERSWNHFLFALADFYVCGIAASVVNSSLKYLTNSITVNFRHNLTKHVHEKYLSNRQYYKHAVLRKGNLDNADQRITDDLNMWCATSADLFSRTFKPLLDVILSTKRMSESMGYKGLTILYSYFFFSGHVIRFFSPPFSDYIQETQKKEGDFRRSHSRLISHAEEVAFLDGAEREKEILNGKLNQLTAWSQYYFFRQFIQGVLDQYFIKYGASMIGWPVLAFPFLLAKDMEEKELVARYREADTLIQNASSSIGDLLMVYKKLQKLSGFTSRVVDLLHSVESGEEEKEKEIEGRSNGIVRTSSNDDEIEFQNVTVFSPDNRLLIKDVSLKIRRGESLFITGANGAGKTSLFRVLAGLWEASEGVVLRPRNGLKSIKSEGGDDGDVSSLFYVPQRPYLVTGSLRDQILYPAKQKSDEDEIDKDDERILECLARVNLVKLLKKGDRSVGLDRLEHDWNDVLSGGEKQRIGLARLYFHAPRFAILDEATSAINPDEEGALYEEFEKNNITVFSIAHRMELKRFHKKHLHFKADGKGNWTLKKIL